MSESREAQRGPGGAENRGVSRASKVPSSRPFAADNLNNAQSNSGRTRSKIPGYLSKVIRESRQLHKRTERNIATIQETQKRVCQSHKHFAGQLVEWNSENEMRLKKLIGNDASV